MFRIADGRETFYQWDLDRQIIVDDETITEVHFCNRTDDCSLVVEVESLEIFADFKPISVLRTAKVPNVLLQSSFDIRVFGYDGKATLHDEVFKVKARTKPSDYVYTEVEISRYEDLNKRIDKIEEEGISQEAIDTSVNKYLEENPIEEITKVSELENDAGYATETYVDNAISNIPTVDLSKHALKSEVPTKVSQLQNDSNFITREEVPETDLSEYAKKSDIPNVSDFITSIPSEYITESELNAKGYSTFSGRYSDLIGKPDIPSVDGLAPVTYVDSKFNSIDLEPYALKALVAQTYAKKSDIPKDYLKEVPAEYITENELAAKGYLKTIPDEYITEDELNAKNYLTSIPSEYVTETELNAKDYATKTYVGEAVKNVEVDLTGYAKEEYVDNAIANIDFIDCYTLVLPTNWLNDSPIVDASTIEYLERVWAGELPCGTVNGVMIISASITGTNKDLLKLDTYNPNVGFVAFQQAVYYVQRHAEGNWTYYNKYDEVKTIPTKTSQVENDSGFITQAYVDEAINGIDIPDPVQEVCIVTIPSSGSGTITDEKSIEYLERLYADEILTVYEKYSDLDTISLVTKIKKSNEKLYLTTISHYGTEILSQTKGYERMSASNWKVFLYTSSTLPKVTKTSQLENDSDFTTKTYVDEAIAGAVLPDGGVSLSNYYTKDETYSKAEIDALFDGIATAEGGAY